LQINDGYFVHFFAPKDLKALHKHVVFVLDVSGSMDGRKIEQLKEAMTAILDDLNDGDYFNIVEFSYSVTVMAHRPMAGGNSAVSRLSGACLCITLMFFWGFMLGMGSSCVFMVRDGI
jgi:hypothetical protein